MRLNSSSAFVLERVGLRMLVGGVAAAVMVGLSACSGGQGAGALGAGRLGQGQGYGHDQGTSAGGVRGPQCHADVSHLPSVNACASGGRVRLFVGGDVLPHRRLQRHAYGGAGFGGIWRQVSPYMRGADIAYVNLETPTAQGLTLAGQIVEHEKPWFDDQAYSTFPHFNVHPMLLDALKVSGVDVVSTANNHALDRLGKGADMTIDALERRGIGFTGTRKADHSHAWWHETRTRHGTVAWLACTYSTNGMPDGGKRVLDCYKNRSVVLSTIRTLSQRNDISAVIVTPHWGVEYQHQPTARQRALARDMVQAGAAAIVGAHSHVIGTWEEMERPGGGNALVIYSLGNFVSSQVGHDRQTSLFGWIELCIPAHMTRGSGSARASGRALVVGQAGYVPTYMNRISNKGPWLQIVSDKSRGSAGQAFDLAQRVVPNRLAKTAVGCHAGD